MKTPRRTSLKLTACLWASLLTLALSDSATAQNFKGGLRAGMVASEVSGDNLAGPNKLGFYAATFAKAPLSEVLAMKLEIMYIEKGSRSVPTERNNFYEYRFALQYVEVPVLLLYDVSAISRSPVLEELVLHGGLSGSVLVGWREEEFGAQLPRDPRRDFNPAELNILLGFSYPLFSSVNFNFGFSNSLTPIRPHAGGGTTWYNRGQYNTLWTFGVEVIIW